VWVVSGAGVIAVCTLSGEASTFVKAASDAISSCSVGPTPQGSREVGELATPVAPFAGNVKAEPAHRRRAM
jgi:hypothetical protein